MDILKIKKKRNKKFFFLSVFICMDKILVYIYVETEKEKTRSKNFLERSVLENFPKNFIVKETFLV